MGEHGTATCQRTLPCGCFRLQKGYRLLFGAFVSLKFYRHFGVASDELYLEL
jgi:hypothetical protein